MIGPILMSRHVMEKQLAMKLQNMFYIGLIQNSKNTLGSIVVVMKDNTVHRELIYLLQQYAEVNTVNFLSTYTSLDNLNNLNPEGLNGGYWAQEKALELIERNKFFKVNILGEPHMNKRGLYLSINK